MWGGGGGSAMLKGGGGLERSRVIFNMGALILSHTEEVGGAQKVFSL